jgi:four helix bundle protein
MVDVRWHGRWSMDEGMVDGAYPQQLRGRRFLRTPERCRPEKLKRCVGSIARAAHRAQRAKSHRDFTAKLTTVLEESAESLFWLRFLQRCGLIAKEAATPFISEAEQLVRIFQTAVRTARAKDDRDAQRRRARARR